MEIETFLNICNFIGITSFAASGVFKGIKHKLDVVGIFILAIITSVGGGLTRDAILSRRPIGLANPTDMYIAIGTTIVIYTINFMFYDIINEKLLTGKNTITKLKKLVLVFDAVGLAVFVNIGASIGIDAELTTISVALIATITGVGGGVIRDVLVGEIPFILKEDIYAVLCFFAGIMYKFLLVDFNFGKITTTLIIFTIVLITRLTVIKYKIHSPSL